MKAPGSVFIAMFALAACNNTQDVQKMKDLVNKDSSLLVQSNHKDSLITSYLSDLSQIQDNLDRIKAREKILTSKSGELQPSVIDQIKQLDEWIVSNDKKMNRLQARLKEMNTKNDNLESIVAHLTREIAEKDEEIATLQTKLSKANDSLRILTASFNDSIVVIRKQRAQVSDMKTEMNTVYYTFGTVKQLQDKGVVDKEGGFIGMGRVAELNQGMDNTMFVKTDLTKLKGINLPGTFRRLLTVHPDKAYVLMSNGKTDSIAITIPSVFWSESKYLVVALK
jgi:uncharacterized coiled-coil protein SlyX